MNPDRDLLAQWAGEELTASTRGTPAARAAHGARNRFYLEMLRCALGTGPASQGTAWPAMR